MSKITAERFHAITLKSLDKWARTYGHYVYERESMVFVCFDTKGVVFAYPKDCYITNARQFFAAFLKLKQQVFDDFDFHGFAKAVDDLFEEWENL